jgi:hypothetical protein
MATRFHYVDGTDRYFVDLAAHSAMYEALREIYVHGLDPFSTYPLMYARKGLALAEYDLKRITRSGVAHDHDPPSTTTEEPQLPEPE